MENTLTIKIGDTEVKFSDFDLDEEMELSYDTNFDSYHVAYFGKEDLISIKNHVEYLLEKLK